jgi:hypothetical protein
MSQRRPIHDRLFRAVVVMGAALGAAACYEHGSSPPTPPDARVTDGGKIIIVDAAPLDVIAIL